VRNEAYLARVRQGAGPGGTLYFFSFGYARGGLLVRWVTGRPMVGAYATVAAYFDAVYCVYILALYIVFVACGFMLQRVALARPLLEATNCSAITVVETTPL
jgi:hypothetical protein